MAASLTTGRALRYAKGSARGLLHQALGHGQWSRVYRQLRRWTLAGHWEVTLNQSGAVPGSLQIIDGTVICAHHQAAGANEG